MREVGNCSCIARIPSIEGQKRAAHRAALGIVWLSDGVGRDAYFRPAALRSSAALSVFSHENAVNFSPLASFISCGVRPKWP